MATSPLGSPRIFGEKIVNRPDLVGFPPEYLRPTIALSAVRPRFRSSIYASFSSSTETQQTRASFSSSPASHYDVLGIPIGASGDEIKGAYRKLVRSVHPDVVCDDRKHASTDEFIRIHAAYATLSDPEKRHEYDRDVLRIRSRRASSFSGNSRRTWETDQCW